MSVSYKAVAAAAKKIVDSGNEPTIHRISEKLGNHKGISACLEKWLELHQPDLTNDTQSTPETADAGISENIYLTTANVSPSTPDDSTATTPASPAQSAAPSEASDINTPKHIDLSATALPPNVSDIGATTAPATPTQSTTPSKDALDLILKDDLTSSESERFKGMSNTQLTIQVRRLESLIAKEQSRCLSTKNITRDLRNYMDTIQQEAELRIEQIKQSSQEAVSKLRQQIAQSRQVNTGDLAHYREALLKAEGKIQALSFGTTQA